MGHQRIHPQFISSKESSTALGAQRNSVTRANQVFWSDHSRVDCSENCRIRNDRTQRFHQIEGQSRPAGPWLMIETDHCIKANAETSDSEVFGQEAVSQR